MANFERLNGSQWVPLKPAVGSCLSLTRWLAESHWCQHNNTTALAAAVWRLATAACQMTKVASYYRKLLISISTQGTTDRTRTRACNGMDSQPLQQFGPRLLHVVYVHNTCGASCECKCSSYLRVFCEGIHRKSQESVIAT